MDIFTPIDQTDYLDRSAVGMDRTRVKVLEIMEGCLKAEHIYLFNDERVRLNKILNKLAEGVLKDGKHEIIESWHIVVPAVVAGVLAYVKELRQEGVLHE